MASKNAHSAVSLRYAGALVDTAEKAGRLPSVEKDLSEFESMLAASADLQAMVASPVIKRDAQVRAVAALADKAGFQAETKNFLQLLAYNRRLPGVADVIAAVRAESARRRGEVSARVQTAFALSPEQSKAVQDAIAKSLGRKVTLNVEVDKTLIGGMIVTVGSHMIDDSVKRKLERLERAMKSNTNQNQTVKKEAV